MKQHQLVITEPDKRGAYEKIRSETLRVFKGGDLFKGLEKTYTPKIVDGDPLPGDKKEIVTTVPQRLEWTEKVVTDLLDFEATRDNTNMFAKADLEVDGVVLVKDIPCTTLLSLEKRLREIRDYYDAIPTLDLSQIWTLINGRTDVYSHGPVEQYRYVKQTKGVVLSQATEKHPAQVKEVTDDVMVGTYKSMHFSGESHPGEKANSLGRIDRLIEAVKRARMKANEVEVKDMKIGKAIFNYIHGRKA